MELFVQLWLLVLLAFVVSALFQEDRKYSVKYCRHVAALLKTQTKWLSFICRKDDDAKSMRAMLDGRVIAQSNDVVFFDGDYYFPETSLERTYTTYSRYKTTPDWKGERSYYNLIVNGRVYADVAWYYADPADGADVVLGCVAFGKDVTIAAVDC